MIRYKQLRTIYIILINIVVCAQNINNNFCGTSWMDASDNCNQRQHCPSGSNDECIYGHTCYADTLCDVTREGHGSNAPLPSFSSTSTSNTNSIGNGLPYEDRANTRFCQSQTITECTIDLWCGDQRGCDDGLVCHYSDCHYHDILKKQEEEQAKNDIIASHQLIISADANDPIRNNFCGSSWEDASNKCSTWCLGEDDKCPDGQTCYSETTCYNDIGLVPTSSPTTNAPSTKPPTVRDDPINFRYCGKTWASTECSLEGHCPTGLECKDDEVCYTIQRCNVHDLTKKPTQHPTQSPILPYNHTSYTSFCGKSYDHATSNCNLNTRCISNEDCFEGSKCYSNLPEQCNPTDPTSSPTTSAPVTKSPTVREDPRNLRFCGVSWDETICSLDKHCPEGTECKNGEMCYTIPRCNVHDLTNKPTPNPTQSPIFNREHISHMKFCGTDVTDAVINCSLETHCTSDESCPIGTSCFDTPPGRSCNAYDMRPTTSPSSQDDVKTATPTRHPIQLLLPKQFCGKTWASISCSKEAWCPVGNECQDGEQCFTNERCNIRGGTLRPTPPPVTPQTYSPTYRWPTYTPTSDDDAQIESEVDLNTPPIMTLQPTPIPRQPTPEPTKQTIQPTPKQKDQSLWCGVTQKDANRNCGEHSFWCMEGEACPFEFQTCFAVDEEDCGSDYVSRTSRPTLHPTKTKTEQPSDITITAKPVLEESNPKPRPQPVISQPNPTSLPRTQRPTPKPETSKPIEDSASSLISTILNPSTLSPTVVSTSVPQTATSQPSIEIPNKPIKPSLQATNKPPTIGKDNVSDDKPSALAILDSISSSNRPKFYCLSHMDKLDEDCPQAMECSVGNACSAGFCMHYDCKGRAPSNGSLDLCPFRFVGLHTKRDCKSYYECDKDGFVGPVYMCEEGTLFDKSSESCIDRTLVNSWCHRSADSYITTPEISTADETASVIVSSYPTQSELSNESTSSTTTSSSPTSHESIQPKTTTPSTSSSISPSKSPLEKKGSKWQGNTEYDLSLWYTSSGGRRKRGLTHFLLLLIWFKSFLFR